MGTNMISIPLPMLASLLCAVIAPLMLRLDPGRRAASIFFALLFADFAVQSLLVGLRFGYGVERFIPLQRVLPLSVGPILYLGFAALAQPPKEFRKSMILHLGIAAVTALVLLVMIRYFREVDVFIALSYIIYAVLLIRLARRGPDHLIFARLDIAANAVRWAWGAAGLLVALLTLDTTIALNFALGGGQQAPALVTMGSALLIAVLLVILASVPVLVAGQKSSAGRPAPQAEDEDQKLEASAREMLNRSQIYLDPDLTVQRIARRLSVPESNLSSAINNSQGMNVSQYVNGFRLNHAARLLRETDASVSKVMTQAGFLTRSNFYREFQRVYGQSPAGYRTQNAGPDAFSQKR
ncbi:Transcriptional regulator, AraC family [Sulfitobacter noctilucicola]|uniref:AraC-like DNA-binding protein n=1 Tax=Sulfitobacter noctilucicola TaxID=1342301 RepID=A0A7W6Q576_9RHOB|nr:helix-turn-helix transcriptional regulator [Sulfitobacter noctilucicola]KIN61937.1 Transcriptional regulator, AraC family [Sulfitobacter noctilucicola]MBB4173542.1 AraC-like DNA-binding protein [Sulfitobacter noctilucicola]